MECKKSMIEPCVLNRMEIHTDDIVCADVEAKDVIVMKKGWEGVQERNC